MRTLGVLVGTALFAAVVAECAYIFKQQRQLAALTEKLAQLEEHSRAPMALDGAGPEPWRGPGGPPEQTGSAGDERGDRGPPPEFLVAMEALNQAAREAGGLANIAASQAESMPLPPALSSPEARAQLRDFVLAQVTQHRAAEERDRQQRRAEQEQSARESMAERLGLSGRDAERFMEINNKSQERRREILEQARQGMLDRTQIREQMRTLWETTNRELESVLGDQKFSQYQELRGGAGWGGGGQGRGRLR